MHKEKLQGIGFRLGGESERLSQDGFDRLTADLSRHRSANAEMVRAGSRELEVFEAVLRATEGISYENS